jgi:hypothetical protein
MLICPCFLIRAQERECWCVSAHRDRGLIKVDRVMLHAARDLTTHRSGRPDEQRDRCFSLHCSRETTRAEHSPSKSRRIYHLTVRIPPVGQEIPLPPLFLSARRNGIDTQRRIDSSHGQMSSTVFCSRVVMIRDENANLRYVLRSQSTGARPRPRPGDVFFRIDVKEIASDKILMSIPFCHEKKFGFLLLAIKIFKIT